MSFTLRSEIRRSARIQPISQVKYNNQSHIEDDGSVVSTTETSDDEEDDLSFAFTTKIDKDWVPLHPAKLSTMKHTRSTRQTTKAVSSNVKIFLPNVGLQASKVVLDSTFHKTYVPKKMNVAISSSTEEDEKD